MGLQDKRDTVRPFKKACVLHLTKERVSSEPNASSSMSARPAGERMELTSAIKENRGMCIQKGETPVRLERMVGYLRRYPDRRAAVLLEEGFRYGFKIPTAVAPSGAFRGNLHSAREHPGVVGEKLEKEVRLGRMAGPFASPPLVDLVVSPLGVVTKKEANKFRLIHHLSFPKGASVNDGIDPELCSVVYTSFDAAVDWVKRFGKGALLAKTDIEAAFRLLPVHPESLRFLGCFWEGGFYVDRCLPMGCSLSCAYFEAFSSFLEWVVREVSGCTSVIHYLDDFLCIGSGSDRVCSLILSTVEQVAADFGVPLAPGKTEGPSTVLSFLGIVIDTDKMECRLPEDKLSALRVEVERAARLRKIKLRELQSLLGKLNFACRIIPMGRIFNRRLAAATAGVFAPHHYVRLGAELRGDLRVWASFLECFNGRALWMSDAVSSFDIDLFTDAAGSVGFGAFCQGHWCFERWPLVWIERGWVKNMALLELFPILVAVVVWGDLFRNRKICFHCDNMGVVLAINQLSASSPPVVKLLQQLVLECLALNAWVMARHVAGISNDIADALSRSQWERFRSLAPAADKEGVACPKRLWDLLEG